jgi:hypothetical protein
MAAVRSSASEAGENLSRKAKGLLIYNPVPRSDTSRCANGGCRKGDNLKIYDIQAP